MGLGTEIMKSHVSDVFFIIFTKVFIWSLRHSVQCYTFFKHVQFNITNIWDYKTRKQNRIFNLKEKGTIKQKKQTLSLWKPINLPIDGYRYTYKHIGECWNIKRSINSRNKTNFSRHRPHAETVFYVRGL